MKIFPNINQVVIKEIEAPTKKNGIIIKVGDSNKREQNQQATVISVGKWYNEITGTFRESEVKEGDVVLVLKHAGSDYSSDSETEEYTDSYDMKRKRPVTFTIIDHSDILAILK